MGGTVWCDGGVYDVRHGGWCGARVWRNGHLQARRICHLREALVIAQCGALVTRGDQQRLLVRRERVVRGARQLMQSELFTRGAAATTPRAAHRRSAAAYPRTVAAHPHSAVFRLPRLRLALTESLSEGNRRGRSRQVQQGIRVRLQCAPPTQRDATHH